MVQKEAPTQTQPAPRRPAGLGTGQSCGSTVGAAICPRLEDPCHLHQHDNKHSMVLFKHHLQSQYTVKVSNNFSSNQKNHTSKYVLSQFSPEQNSQKYLGSVFRTVSSPLQRTRLPSSGVCPLSMPKDREVAQSWCGTTTSTTGQHRGCASHVRVLELLPTRYLHRYLLTRGGHLKNAFS